MIGASVHGPRKLLLFIPYIHRRNYIEARRGNRGEKMKGEIKGREGREGVKKSGWEREGLPPLEWRSGYALLITDKFRRSKFLMLLNSEV